MGKPPEPPTRHIVRKLRFFGLAGLCVWAVISGLSCSNNNTAQNFNYLRSPSDFSVDTAKVDTLCSEPQPNFGGEEECRDTKKFVLHWESPEDTSGFLGYRIYLDTTPPNAGPGKTWKDVQSQENLASIFVPWNHKTKEDLVFYLTDTLSATHVPDTLKANNKIIFALDTNGRVDADGKIVYATSGAYSEEKMDAVENAIEP